MRNKFLKMTFMALCLSTSSALHAMIEDTLGCSGEHVHAGKYKVRDYLRNKSIKGSVTIQQGDDHPVLENLAVTRYTKKTSLVEPERDRIARFVSAMPTPVQLKFLGGSERGVQYGAETPFDEGDKTPMYVRLITEKNSYGGDSFYQLFLEVEAYYGTGSPLPPKPDIEPSMADIKNSMAVVELFRLFKVGSDEHLRLLEASASLSPCWLPFHPAKSE